ncbi:MAG: molybdenum cofactor guanylyltransferase MobA, partial [Pseudomonadales bacterium]|nr:molybdenum cofactor guanylyltransferase MobA [Pseudomonadales bacterium]
MAGGLSRRMGGGDKCQLMLKDKTLLERVIERAKPQVDTLLLNANGDPKRFQRYSLPVVADCVEGYAGPLAGILTGMQWAKLHYPDCQWLASFASDSPFFPTDLVVRLARAIEHGNGDIACAKSGGQLHPVFGLWPVRLYDDLKRALLEEELRKMGTWIARYHCVEVSYDINSYD